MCEEIIHISVTDAKLFQKLLTPLDSREKYQKTMGLSDSNQIQDALNRLEYELERIFPSQVKPHQDNEKHEDKRNTRSNWDDHKNPETFSEGIKELISFRQKYQCASCEKIFSKEEMKIHEIKPWSKNHQIIAQNCEILCDSCFTKKEELIDNHHSKQRIPKIKKDSDSRDVVMVSVTDAVLFRDLLGDEDLIKAQEALQRLDWQFDRLFPEELAPPRQNAWPEGFKYVCCNWDEHKK